ncbi:MAG: UvrABC system protein A [bacterium ADurb.Bin400]|nr:MAG: UvrABC system protein A [bacterium ADurb.Bin400]
MEKGNTVLVIEHNLDIIKSADHLIDLGPDGGDKGGQIIATGTPEEVAKVDDSHTGQYLRILFDSANQKSTELPSPKAKNLVS